MPATIAWEVGNGDELTSLLLTWGLRKEQPAQVFQAEGL